MTINEMDHFLATHPPVIDYHRPTPQHQTDVAEFHSKSVADKLAYLHSLHEQHHNPYMKPRPPHVEILRKGNSAGRLTHLENAVAAQTAIPTKSNTKTKTKKKTIPKALRMSVWTTYVGKDVGTTMCLCCQHNEISQLAFECGHVIAEANGGPTVLDNLRPICSICNKSMGTQSMDEFKLKFVSSK